jgi:hypothetical protein
MCRNSTISALNGAKRGYAAGSRTVISHRADLLIESRILAYDGNSHLRGTNKHRSGLRLRFEVPRKPDLLSQSSNRSVR